MKHKVATVYEARTTQNDDTAIWRSVIYSLNPPLTIKETHGTWIEEKFMGSKIDKILIISFRNKLSGQEDGLVITYAFLDSKEPISIGGRGGRLVSVLSKTFRHTDALFEFGYKVKLGKEGKLYGRI